MVELLFAMMIGLITISSVVLVTETLTGGEINSELIERARATLERVQATGHIDFNTVNADTMVAGAYTDTTEVDMLTDYTTKRVRARSSFATSYGNIETELITLITNRDNIFAPDTCSSVLSGDWEHPQIASYSYITLIGTTTGPYSISDIDAFKGHLYISSDRRAYRTDPALYVFSLSGGPLMVGKVSGTFAATLGFTAVRVAENAVPGSRHAYAMSKTAAQFQSIDVSNPALPSIVASRSLLGGEGNSISFYNGYVYAGLSASAGTSEMHIINVQNPNIPVVTGKWPSSGSIGSGVNAIRVRGNYAYIAHGLTATYPEQITVVNVQTPASPYRVSGYVAPLASTFPNSGNGKSLALVGDTLFVGRTASNKVAVPQFVMVDAERPYSLGATAVGSVVLVPDVSIQRIIIRDTLAFILTSTKLLIYTIEDLTNPSLYASIPLPTSGGSMPPSMDCEGNTLYIGSNDAANFGTLSVITAI